MAALNKIRKNRRLLRLVFVLCLPAMLLLLSRTAFAKTTYVITDGNRVFTYESFATDPADVLTEAGLSLDEYDTFTTEASFGSTSLTIRRSRTVTIRWGEDVMTAESAGETVSELLSRLNIYPGEFDVLSVSPETVTEDGMIIAIDTVFRETQTYAAAIPHETIRCLDDSLPEGEERILMEGRDGELRCTANVTYVNGEETERELVSQTVIRNPQDEIVAVGTGKAQAEPDSAGELVIGDGTIILPTGEILTYTHSTQVRATAYNHLDEGCDMITATGTTVHVGTVAVDPRYIPYGTRMFIVSNDGAYIYGISVAEDCGGAIKGDRVDLYFPTLSECFAFGRRNCTIYFLG